MRRSKSQLLTPTNTPQLPPRNEAAGMPACSNACHATSSTSPCCGSMAAASATGIPKNSASKQSPSATKPPHLQCVLSGMLETSDHCPAASQREGGTSEMASPPSSSSFQNSSSPSACG